MERTFIFLGTGTSVGVPMIGCNCAVCQSTNPRNHRYRCSALIRTSLGNILIDTTPELRLQLLRERIPVAHAVLYTHYHADHLMGLDDLRLFPRSLGGPLPIYCTEGTEQVIRRTFPYAFHADTAHLPFGVIPRLVFRTIGNEPFDVLGEHITPVPLRHAWFDVMGFRIGNLAYCTDLSEIPERSMPLLAGLDVLILDCLRQKPHPAHLSLEQSLDIINRLKPGRAYLTHMAHELDYETINPTLPAPVEMAYDGLKLVF
ncbi:MAG TPA: MBL fold metallo-hydrolase [Gemmataceae bacterium]|nr:MBL fold metallo-hydrolase [Gemmataceae bacterium]